VVDPLTAELAPHFCALHNVLPCRLPRPDANERASFDLSLAPHITGVKPCGVTTFACRDSRTCLHCRRSHRAAEHAFGADARDAQLGASDGGRLPAAAPWPQLPHRPERPLLALLGQRPLPDPAVARADPPLREQRRRSNAVNLTPPICSFAIPDSDPPPIALFGLCLVELPLVAGQQTVGAGGRADTGLASSIAGVITPRARHAAPLAGANAAQHSKGGDADDREDAPARGERDVACGERDLDVLRTACRGRGGFASCFCGRDAGN